MEKITIRDIAKMAGVSTTAVSFVLNDRPGVSDATRKRVQEIIAETGFAPNVHSRKFAQRQSYTIHVLTRQYDYSLFNLFVMDVLSGIFRESKALGYSIIFTAVSQDNNSEELLETIHSREADGVIFIQVCNHEVIRQLEAEHMPYLCVDSHMPQDGTVPLVEVNYYDAVQQAIQYLVDMGHQDIGFLISDRHEQFYKYTFTGFCDAMRQHGLTLHQEWMQRIIHNIPQPATRAMEKILSCDSWPTAVFCASDTYAANAMRYAINRGLQVPEDISFIGLDNLVISEYTNPAITTMDVDKVQMGRQAMRSLYDMINGTEVAPVQLVPTTLIERNSVRRL